MTDWYNNVPAPMDADGKIVPLGVKKLYASDGEALDVELIGFDGRWVVKFDRRGLFNLDWFHLSEPDSWERLEKDIQRAAGGDVCGYYNKAGKSCGDCPAHRTQDSCLLAELRDVMRRAKALAERGDVE